MRRITFSLIVFCLLSLSLFSARANVQFCKSITYYLIDDIPMARKYINLYFDSLPDPILKNAFSLLFRKKNWDATRQFNNYLNLKHRSNYAIVGIALATADMKDSTSMDNLKKAIRLNPAFSPAYLCLGFEYMKQKKYPQAEKNLNLAFRNSRIPDYKIILSHLYLKLKEPKIVVDLVKREAERHPDNFHFNFLTATALFQLNKFKEMQYFIEASIENKPDNNEAKLLWSKYLLNQNELKRAKSILSRLKFREYNENYVKTMASVLLKLKDNNAKSYLYEFFSGNQWDQDINRLMGTYHLNK